MIYNREISKKISKFAQEREKFVFAINFDGSDGFVLTPEQAAEENIFFDIGGVSNFNYRRDDVIAKSFNINPVAYEDYKKAFEKVQYHIKRGDTFLVNLTFRTEINTDYSLDEIFNHSKALYKLLYKDDFVIFSPECFVRTRGNKIQSFPMKGTIDARIENAEEIILNSRKEFCEHTTIVDLIRNDLNMIGNNTEVEKFRYVDKIVSNRGELLQVSSIISSELPEDYYNQSGDILYRLLPAGSISGAPKEKTLAIIRDAETYDRAYYTGIFGYFDGNDFDTAVSIRFIEKEGGKTWYKSGGGITAMSEPEKEYEELIKKIYVPFS